MIVTPGVTDDTPQTAITINLLERVLEYRLGPLPVAWPDAYTTANMSGFAYRDPGQAQPNPIPQSIVVRETKIANDIYFVTGTIDYRWFFDQYGFAAAGPEVPIRDGFFACCRLDKLNDLSAWHILFDRGIQNIFNSNPALIVPTVAPVPPGIPSSLPQIPDCDPTLDGGMYGMAVSDGFGLNDILNYSSPTDGTAQIAQGVFCHTVGGVGITATAGTVINNALPVGGQVSYPMHHMYYAIPLDGVTDGTALNANLIPATINAAFNISNTYNITNYAVWGELVVIGVADSSITGANAAPAIGGNPNYSGVSAVPMLFGSDLPTVSSKNYNPWTAGSLIDNFAGTGKPILGGGMIGFYRDITLTGSTDMMTFDGNEAASLLGQFMAVGWAYTYASGIATSAITSPLVTIGDLRLSQTLFAANRSYCNTPTGAAPNPLPTTPIARQTDGIAAPTPAQQEGTDVLDGSYYTAIQQLSTTQGGDEPILLRLYVPQFDAAGKPWENLTHITYHYTCKNLLNGALGFIPQPTGNFDTMQIGPLISSNTQTNTWQTFPTTEERGFQNTNLSNTFIYGTAFARPDTQNIQSGIQNWGKAFNNVPRFSADIRGFCGSYSPTNDAAADWETVRPYILTYDTANGSTILPDYAAMIGGSFWSIAITSSCFFDYGTTPTATPLQDSVVAEMNQYTAQVAVPLDTTAYLIGGVMNMAYDLDRNQWVLSISANRNGAENNPAWFMAANSNLSRYVFFKTGGIKNPVLAQHDQSTAPPGGPNVPQTTSFMFTDCAGGSDTFKAYTLGGNFGSADGVGGTYVGFADGFPGISGAIQLTKMEAVGGKSVVMWVDYLLFDGVDSLIATVVQELGLSVTVENVEWYKRKMISGDVLNMTNEEIEAWVQSQQAEYRKMLIDNERQGRVRRRRRQQSAIAHDLEEQIQGEFVVSEMDFIEGDFIERNLKNISAFPDQDEALKHQIITDEQWNSLDSLYGTPVPKKSTSLERKRKAAKQPESDAEDEKP